MKEGGKKTRTEIEEERLRHCQGRRRRLQSGLQDLDALFQLALAQKRHGQIINGLEKKRKFISMRRSRPALSVTIHSNSMLPPPPPMMIMTMTHSVVRIVLLDKSAQERVSRFPVPARGREEGGVERFGRFGHVGVCCDGGEVRLGLVELSGLEVDAAERGAQLAVGR